MNSVVYFISNNAGLIKIGRAVSIKRRLSCLKVGNPIGYFDLIGSIVGDKRAEKAIHHFLAEYRRVGEWFEDCDPVRSAIGHLLQGGVEALGLVLEQPRRAPRSSYETDARACIHEICDLQQFLGAASIPQLADLVGLPRRLLWSEKYCPKSSGISMSDLELIVDAANQAVRLAQAKMEEIELRVKAASKGRDRLIKRDLQLFEALSELSRARMILNDETAG